MFFKEQHTCKETRTVDHIRQVWCRYFVSLYSKRANKDIGDTSTSKVGVEW